jgi:hypothetical protein
MRIADLDGSGLAAIDTDLCPEGLANYFENLIVDYMRHVFTLPRKKNWKLK